MDNETILAMITAGLIIIFCVLGVINVSDSENNEEDDGEM